MSMAAHSIPGAVIEVDRKRLHGLLRGVLRLNTALNAYWADCAQSTEPLDLLTVEHCREIMEAQNLVVALGDLLLNPTSGGRH